MKTSSTSWIKRQWAIEAAEQKVRAMMDKFKRQAAHGRLMTDHNCKDCYWWRSWIDGRDGPTGKWVPYSCRPKVKTPWFRSRRRMNEDGRGQD